MAGSNSIINFEDLSKPATVLVEKIAAAVEGIYKPNQIKRIAKAQADAAKIEAESQIEIHELQQRALSRFVAEESKKQENMEKITEKALPLLEGSSEPQNMEDDWITNFFDKCRIISDTEMQTLWAKILAGEANAPGTYSKRTVNFLDSLDKSDADLFTTLCGFKWKIQDYLLLIYNETDSIYVNQGINYNSLAHLDDIGLVHFEVFGTLDETKLPKLIQSYYFDICLNLELQKSEDNNLSIGKALFTKTGEQLAKICGAKPVDGFYDYVIEKWSKEGLILSSPLIKKL